MPTEEQCKSCKIEKCPFSRFAPKAYGASWKNEVRELDERKLFFKAVKKRIEKQFEGLKAEGFGIRDECAISLFPYGIKDTVGVNLNKELLVDMLYHPGKHNIEEIANGLPVEICIPGYYKGKEYVKPKYVAVPENADIQFCYDQWAREWFEEENTENCDSVREGMNFFEKIKNFFMNLGVILTLFYNLPFELINFRVADVLLMISSVLCIVITMQYIENSKKYIKMQ